LFKKDKLVADPRVFSAFNFLVSIEVPGVSNKVCEAAFAECDGLELSMEPKSFQQGGCNTEQIHLAGPVSYGQLTLRRGMSKNDHLWRWFAEVMKTENRGLRGQASISMLGADGDPDNAQVTFNLKDCLPVRMRAPTLNASEGLLAIEEMQLVYAALSVEFPESG
jgi:phage tail-like protein